MRYYATIKVEQTYEIEADTEEQAEQYFRAGGHGSISLWSLAPTTCAKDAHALARGCGKNLAPSLRSRLRCAEVAIGVRGPCQPLRPEFPRQCRFALAHVANVLGENCVAPCLAPCATHLQATCLVLDESEQASRPTSTANVCQAL